MGQIPAPYIEDLVCRVDLAAIISERVSLKKGGNTYKARCPFHDEKTPSFVVYNEDQPPRYHCYGCGAHGNAIDFIRETEHLGFSDAVEALSRRMGLEVPRDALAQQTFDKIKPLFSALAFAQQCYQSALQQHPQALIAKEYLQQRAISDEMINLYGLGFAPAGRQLLVSRASTEQLRACAELKLIHDNGTGRADLFQNRLMFPIRDSRGRTVAFAGRTLVGERSKYINSSESAVFHKSNLLYGLWEARKQSRKLDQLIVVEGYLDVIALAQFGITNAVAAMGTATNEQNLSNLLSVSNDILFCFDGDRAGVAAANKALNHILPLLEDGHKVSFLVLPEGDDPDSLVRKEGADQFKSRINAATPLSEYFFKAFGSGLNLSIPEDKGILSSRCKEALQKVRARVLKDGLYQRLRELTRSPKWNKSSYYNSRRNQPGLALVAEDPVEVPNRTVAKVCLGLYQNPGWAKDICYVLDYDITEQDESALPVFLRWILDAQLDTREDLLFQLATDRRLRHRFSHLFNNLKHIFDDEANQNEAQDMLQVLQKKHLRIRYEAIEKRVLLDPKNPELQAEYRTVTQELNSLRR